MLRTSVRHRFVGPLATDIPEVAVAGCAGNSFQQLNTEVHLHKGETLIIESCLDACNEVGFVAAFLSAMVVVSRLLDFVSLRGYAVFAGWRIAGGLATLLGWIAALALVIMLFLITVVFIALRLGRLAGVWASLLSVAFFDFFFVEPRYSFSVTDTQYVFTFGVMLGVALIIGQLAAKLQAEARAARDGERRAAALTRVSRDLAGALGA